MLEAIYVVRHGVSTLHLSCFFAKSSGSDRAASGHWDMSQSVRHYKQENVSTQCKKIMQWPSSDLRAYAPHSNPHRGHSHP